jgi:hypothetical protein
MVLCAASGATTLLMDALEMHRLIFPVGMPFLLIRRKNYAVLNG